MSIYKKRAKWTRRQDDKLRDKQRVADLLLQGYDAKNITEILNTENPYNLALDTIKTDIKALKHEWAEYRIDTYEMFMGEELQRLKMIERELWGQWFLSKRKSEEQNEGKIGGFGNTKYMTLILDCVTKRVKILGLETNTNNLTIIQQNLINRSEIYNDFSQLKQLSDGELVELLEKDKNDQVLLSKEMKRLGV